MLRIAQMPKRGCQIGGANEYAVDSLYFRDRFELIESCSCFDLDKNANLVVGPGQISRHAAITAGPFGDRNATDSLWRISRRHDRALGLLDILHVGEEQRLRADVERAFRQHGIIPCRPDDWCRRATLYGL